MKLFKFPRYVFLICLLPFSLLVGCQDGYLSTSFVKVETERTKLINGIESYQSIDEFKGFLNRSLLQWEVCEVSQPSSKGRPPFDLYTIKIKSYSHLGFSGEVYIDFFNNRLSGITFYSSDVEKYFEALKNSAGIKLDDKQEAKLPPYTYVRLAVDYRGKKYIGWSDIRLDREISLWIRKYS